MVLWSIDKLEGHKTLGVVLDLCGPCDPDDADYFHPIQDVLYRDRQQNIPNNLKAGVNVRVPCGGLGGELWTSLPTWAPALPGTPS
ncbi:unnamed protein product, partial [Choristocarpus tenellus]